MALDQLLGESASIVGVREQVARLLRSAAGPARRLPPVLILGETGTGKGLLAGAIHRGSARARGPFVDVNCAAIPETLLEAELFGFERGAFTDARQAKPGLFQAASGGTIFLDEVGLLPLSLQSKLLKVLEERSVRRLGSTRSEALDVCIIAATSEDLAGSVQRGRFRPDLYHRLAVVTMALPPLRARGRDVLLLARHFLARICHDYGLPPKGLAQDAEAVLLAYSWPGNVRELGNVLERAALLTDERVLTPAHLGLPAAPRRPAPAPEVAEADETERRRLQDVLRATGWNFSRAAVQLGVPRNTLRYRAERLGLVPEGPPERRRGGRPRATATAERPAAAPAPAADERRRVTLLEARLVSTSAEASSWGGKRTLDELAQKVESFGGQVEEVGPAGLLAAFGLTPEEGAPLRAAHAAMAAQKLLARARAEGEVRPDVALALHTASLALVRAGGDLRVDAEARREARRTLAILLEGAEAGAVVASPEAMRFLARRFELAPGPGGTDEAPPAAWRVVRHADPGRTRFVGRERELRLLAERFELARAGQGQVVLIVGEPGIGKSRLLHEFRRRLSGAIWAEGQALSYGGSVPFHPIVDMLRRVFRIDDADPETVVADKIERGVRRLGDDLGHTLPFLRYLLSVDPGDPAVAVMDPKLRHAEIMRATYLLLERGAARQPHVLVLEDAHWCDAATEDWIARLTDSVAAKRVLIVVTYRPGYRPPFGDRTFHTGLALATLSSEETLGIARSLLEVEELPPALQALILDKAEGNPFFVEELVRALQELGAVRRAGSRLVLSPKLGQVTVPDSVEELLLARIHRLEPGPRGLLDVAAVIGKDVSLPLLRIVSGRADEPLAADLRRLQAAEFLYETRVFPEVELTFKHALTQDVAYGNVRPDERRALHGRIVEAIERLYPERLGEHVERLAHHAMRGELWSRAARYARQAGTKAFDRSANREAVASLDQALMALARLPDSRERAEEAIDIRLALRSALLQLGQIRRIAGVLAEAETLARGIEDHRRLAWVWIYTASVRLFTGEPLQALEVGERSFRLAEEIGDVALRATARTPWAHAYRERGDHRRAVELFREAIALLAGDLVRQRLGQAMPPSLYARSMAAVCLADLGEFTEASRLGAESASLAQALDLPFGLALARIALGYTSLMRGDLPEAAATLDLALETIAARDLPAWFPWAAAVRGHVAALQGRAGEAGQLLDAALERAVTLPFLFGHSLWVAWQAHARLAAGRPEEALELAREAVRLARRRGERGYEAWALQILGEVSGSSDAEAEACHREALGLATELGMQPLVAHAHLGFAAASDRSGKPREAREHRAAGAALADRLGMRLPGPRAVLDPERRAGIEGDVEVP